MIRQQSRPPCGFEPNHGSLDRGWWDRHPAAAGVRPGVFVGAQELPPGMRPARGHRPPAPIGSTRALMARTFLSEPIKRQVSQVVGASNLAGQHHFVARPAMIPESGIASGHEREGPEGVRHRRRRRG